MRCILCRSRPTSRWVPILVQQRYLCGAWSSTAIQRSSFHYKKQRLAPEDAVDPLTKPANIDKSSLHLVSVPIGNLKDFSYRAVEVLREVDYIITSDRPATKSLLDLINIPNQGRLIHYSRSNSTASRDKLVEMLKGGRSMAFVTTSGTPCVGDVGGELVQEMLRSGIRVTSVPGPSAAITALSICGVAKSRYERDTTDEADQPKLQLDGLQDGSFFFGNMLPEAHGERLRALRSLVAPASYPCVFYEVPRRLHAVLQDIALVVPRRLVYVVHELTKLNESVHVDTAEKLSAFYLRFEAHALLKKGQVVLVIGPAGPREIAAWLAKEAQKRMRMRRELPKLTCINAPSSALAGTAASTSEAKKRTRKSLKARRADRLRRRREKLIRDIEVEQERLRLNMHINVEDALKV